MNHAASASKSELHMLSGAVSPAEKASCSQVLQGSEVFLKHKLLLGCIQKTQLQHSSCQFHSPQRSISGVNRNSYTQDTSL